ncbi:MAG: hypothetical protein JWP89_5119 [Schlesneria sp.]|nr:hypothetical protein [Schlesneria sp.]
MDQVKPSLERLIHRSGAGVSDHVWTIEEMVGLLRTYNLA